MKAFAFLPLLSAILCYDLIRPGTLFISMVGNTPVHRDLYKDMTKLVTSSEVSKFQYNPEGILEMLDSGKYLSIGSGKLVLSDKRHKGFSLKSEAAPPTSYRRTVEYNGSSEFELCGDKSIGFQSSCAGARSIKITYEDIIQPR